MDIDADGDQDILQLSTTSSSVFLQSGSGLPVKLVSFTLAKRGQQVLVSWKTTEEINADHFTVEYSLDAINFVPRQNGG